MKYQIKTIVFILLTTFVAAVSAAPKVELTMTAEKEQVVEGVTKRVSVSEVMQGEVIFYTLHYKNTGDEAATDVRLDNPIANGTTYLAGSAWGDNAVIKYTVNGSDYLTAEEMSKTSNNEENITALRWELSEVNPGTEGQVGFKATVD